MIVVLFRKENTFPPDCCTHFLRYLIIIIIIGKLLSSSKKMNWVKEVAQTFKERLKKAKVEENDLHALMEIQDMLRFFAKKSNSSWSFVIIFLLLTLQNHPLFYALFEPAILATVPLSFGNFTGTICHTCVDPPILHRSLEKPFATGKNARKKSNNNTLTSGKVRVRLHLYFYRGNIPSKLLTSRQCMS